MINYTFTVIKRDPKQNNLYDLFSFSGVRDIMSIQKYLDVVNDGEECRMDLISKRLYGTSAYVEELMRINNILNPFSVNAGDPLYFVMVEDLEYYRYVDFDSKVLSTRISNPKDKKGTRVDPTRQTGVPPTIRPIDFKQILVDKQNKTIKLNTKLS